MHVVHRFDVATVDGDDEIAGLEAGRGRRRARFDVRDLDSALARQSEQAREAPVDGRD